MDTLKIESKVIHQVLVWGVGITELTGCTHYNSAVDIIAIKFKCCHHYFSCYTCHEAFGHPAVQWTVEEFDTPAILCGNCGFVLTIQAYLDSESKCPCCLAPFNPQCHLHWDLYFARV